MRIARNWHADKMQRLKLGERAADRMRNGMGSWTFVLAALIFIAGWVFANSYHGFDHWDKFPFILLNLFLSIIAALQGAILLIAAKRADSVSAAAAQHDYETNTAAKEEIETLMELNKKQLHAIDELKKIIEDQKKTKKS